MYKYTKCTLYMSDMGLYDFVGSELLRLLLHYHKYVEVY